MSNPSNLLALRAWYRRRVYVAGQQMSFAGQGGVRKTEHLPQRVDKPAEKWHLGKGRAQGVPWNRLRGS